MDFNRWLNSQSDAAKEREADAARAKHEAELEEDGTAWQRNDGSWRFKCCACGQDFELPVDTMEIEVGQEMHGNCSDRCIP